MKSVSDSLLESSCRTAEGVAGPLWCSFFIAFPLLFSER
jgi:hypothetical protein